MCICPMVVSQWGLNSKNNQGKTGPGHSMVVSQWSSSEFWGAPFTLAYKCPPREVSAPGTGGISPMEVSKWGLHSKNNQGKTGPGYSMVVSQWSSSEHRVLQSTWRTSAPPREVPAHGQRGDKSSCSYRFHVESPQRVTKPLTPQGL